MAFGRALLFVGMPGKADDRVGMMKSRDNQHEGDDSMRSTIDSMTARCRVVLLAMLAAGLGPAACASVSPAVSGEIEGKPGEVSIRHTAPLVHRRSFDPRHPPSELPRLSEDEAAVTVSRFGCACAVRIRMTTRSGSDGTVRTKVLVDRIEPTLSLEITLWLPEPSKPKLEAHEQAHRRIAEWFYARADSPTRRVAEELIGRSVEVDGDDGREAGERLMAYVTDRVNSRFIEASSEACNRVQDGFDRLTDHARNTMDEQRAIERAMRDCGHSSDSSVQ